MCYSLFGFDRGCGREKCGNICMESACVNLAEYHEHRYSHYALFVLRNNMLQVNAGICGYSGV